MESYEVVFLDEDEQTVLDKQIVKHGDAVSYKGKTPEKEATNQMTYTFVGWTNEEKMQCVTENLTLVAKYTTDLNTISKDEIAMLKASLENAQNTNINATIQAGQKVSNQLNALKKDSRKPEEIVNEVLKNGKTEIGIDANKDNVER